MLKVPLPFSQKTTWFFLPWLLWLTCLVAIFFFGESDQPTVWLVCFIYAVTLFGLHRTLNHKQLVNSHSLSFRQGILSATPFLLDLCFYGMILMFHGGASNAGVSVLYLPVIVAAMAVKRRIAWLVTVVAIVIYTGLMMQGHAAHFNHLSESFANHLSGMWLTFVISVLLITWFVTQQRQAIIAQQRQITQLRERQLRDEQILAVATLGANTTHRLATPLSTANLLVEELQQTKQFDQVLVDDLSSQIHVCHQTVHQIANQVRTHQAAQTKQLPVNSFIEQTLQYWWVSRNDIEYKLVIDSQCMQLSLLTDFNLQMSLSNLLENAAYASLNNHCSTISITVSQSGDNLVVNIDDKGQGIAPELLSKLGQKPISNKPNGMGMGLALANATIERFGGSLQLFNLEQGSRSQVLLPVIPIN